jgi:hypothetical protein
MTQNPNLFVRGYWNLKIVRTLSISYEDGSPHVWRTIHASQQHLSDEELVSSACIVTSDFAVVRNGTESVSAELMAECDATEGVIGEGVVGAVVYAIHGDDLDGRPVHVGDTYSAEAAREVVQRLSFETGYYSRCWEDQQRAHQSGNRPVPRQPGRPRHAGSLSVHRLPGSVQPGDRRQADLHALDGQEPGVCRGHQCGAASAGASEQGYAGRPGEHP